MEKKLSIVFGFLIGSMWMGEVVLGNLGGTPVLGNVRYVHPQIWALAVWFAWGAVFFTVVAGLVAAYRTGSVPVALRVGVWSGLISAGILCVTGVAIYLLFHDALVKDPSYIQEFARTSHHAPTDAELSRFLLWDGIGGIVNHFWIGPLLGVTAGGIGALLGKWQFTREHQSA